MGFVYKNLNKLIVAIILGGAYFWSIYFFDTRWRFIPYTLAFTATLAALFFLFTRRFFSSGYVGALIVLLMTMLSLVKYTYIGFALHIYDFLFLGADVKSIGFAAKAYPLLSVAALVLLVIATVFVYGMFRYEKPLRFPPAARLALVFVFAGAAYSAHPMHYPREASYLPQIAGYHASALPLSVFDLPDMLGDPPVLERVRDVAEEVSVDDEVLCGAPAERADIIMTLAESQVSPELYPQIRFTEETVDSFRSGDGKIRNLFVESVGAGTWMTNFSVLTGLYTRDFGWQAAYVTQLMEGKVRGALPDLLSRCGYRTIFIMPFASTALNEGRFMQSIGFQEVYDSAATGLEPMEVPDSGYFNFVRQLIEAHRAADDDRPLFIHIQTMFSHQPYVSKLLPEIMAPEFQIEGENAEMEEYARRVAISRRDFADFKHYLNDKPGSRGSIWVEFGDHHAIATEALDVANGEKQALMADAGSDIYRTYYAVHGFGREIDYSQLYPTTDAALLVADVLKSAGLPTSPLFEKLTGVSAGCETRMRSCANSDAGRRVLKGRIKSGLLLAD